jgi:polyhydroxyalkanoate synthesis repressor PhaR
MSSAQDKQTASRIRLIKRYGNRKLYDVRSSKYVTLEGVRTLVQGGEDVRVVDNDSGEDLTAITFAQIIYEEAKRANGGLSLPLLRWLIERGDEAVRDVIRGVERGREALENVRDAAEKRVQTLVHPKGGNSRKLLGELMEAPQRRLDELQRRIDSQVRQSVERVTHHPAFRKEIQRVERSIHQLEKQLGKLTKTRKPPVRARRKAKK